MRERIKNAPEVRPIHLSDIDRLKRDGFEIVQGTDAAKANSDFFVIMTKRDADNMMQVKIVCPTFLRGPLSIGRAVVIGY